jgi:hypothetical protein
MIHYLPRTDRTPDVKALREELAWRRQLPRTLQIMQMKPAYSAELEALQKHERWMRGYLKQANKALERQRTVEEGE